MKTRTLLFVLASALLGILLIAWSYLPSSGNKEQSPESEITTLESKFSTANAASKMILLVVTAEWDLAGRVILRELSENHDGLKELISNGRLEILKINATNGFERIPTKFRPIIMKNELPMAMLFHPDDPGNPIVMQGTNYSFAAVVQKIMDLNNSNRQQKE